MMNRTLGDIKKAYLTTDAREFMDILFPEEWAPIAARIIETGVVFSGKEHKFAPRWNKVPATTRQGECPMHSWVKSCIFRVHDLIHQLWGLPIPKEFTEEEFYSYKRAQMCGEVVVLMFTEFYFVNHLLKMYPHFNRLLYSRNALSMLEGPLKGKSPIQIVTRMDNILHQHKRPRWVRGNIHATAFADDYVPMLERDRNMVDHNWDLMKKLNWLPTGAPNSRYSSDLDGMELTLWMVNDFLHLMSTDPVVDEGLAKFNRDRRDSIILPEGWDNC
jgi:hypothetical protein